MCVEAARATEDSCVGNMCGSGSMETRIHILLTHLTPRDARARMFECEYLAQRCAALSANDTPAILLGDMNTLSHLDDTHYAASKLQQTLAKDTRLQKKFLRKADDSPFEEAGGTVLSDVHLNLDYRPMRALLASGMFDLSIAFENEDANGECVERSGEFQATVGTTNVKEDGMHAGAMRLDYILGNRAVRPFCHRPVFAVRDAETVEISDHLPVILHLMLHST